MGNLEACLLCMLLWMLIPFLSSKRGMPCIYDFDVLLSAWLSFLLNNSFICRDFAQCEGCGVHSRSRAHYWLPRRCRVSFEGKHPLLWIYFDLNQSRICWKSHWYGIVLQISIAVARAKSQFVLQFARLHMCMRLVFLITPTVSFYINVHQTQKQLVFHLSLDCLGH